MSYAQTDWRGLCEAMVDEWDAVADQDLGAMEKAVERARAALAQQEPEVVGPSDEEMYELWDTECGGGDFQDCRRFARAVLSRWGRAALSQPEGEGAGPTDEELESDFRAWWKERYGESYFGSAPLVSVIDWAKHAIARFGGRPTPAPAVGEATVDLIIAAYRSGVADARIMAEAESRPAPAPAGEAVELSEVLDWIRGVEPWATWLAPGGSLESAHIEIAQLVTEAVARFGRLAPAPAGEVSKEEIDCETCEGSGTIDETLGGYGDSNPAATCPDCDGTGVIVVSAPSSVGADGELVAWLAGQAVRAADCRQPKAAGMLTWAAQVVGEHADLVERQAAPVPVAVSEQPYKRQGWCDDEGFCWWFDRGSWIWLSWYEGFSWGSISHCLPHDALPLPTPEPQP